MNAADRKRLLIERKRRWNRRSNPWRDWQGPANHSWSALDDARYLALHAIGCPIEVAGEILERSEDAMRHRLRHTLRPLYLGGRRRRSDEPSWQGERLAKLAQLIEVEKRTFTAAARVMNTSRSAVAGAVDRHLRRNRKIGARPCADADMTTRSSAAWPTSPPPG